MHAHVERSIKCEALESADSPSPASALAARPALVLADEPTASLDPENTETAMDLIQSACRAEGAALLCTSHDPAMRARFARIESIDAMIAGAAR